MYLTREQFKVFQKICLKLRVPMDSVYLDTRQFLKLAKVKKAFHFVISSKLKVCRKRVIIVKCVKRVGSFYCAKIIKIKKKNTELRKLCRKICSELRKRRKENLKNKKSKITKVFNKGRQIACDEEMPQIDLTSEKDNSEGSIAEDFENAEAIKNVDQTAVVIVSDDDGASSNSRTSSKEDGPNLREKIRTQLELLRAKKNDFNAFVSPVILNYDQFELNKKTDDEIIDLDPSNEYDDIEIIEQINNVNDSFIQTPEQLIHQLDKLKIIEDNLSIHEKSAEDGMAIVPQRKNKESKALGNEGILNLLYEKFNIKKKQVYRSAPVIDPLNRSPTSSNIEASSMKLLPKNKVCDMLDDSSSSYSEFYGFDNENDEVIKNLRHNPDLLPTPYVSKVRTHAAFLTDDININEITIEQHKEDTNAKKRLIVPSDKIGLANEFSTPPKLTLPARPKYMEKPRTVAQKRVLLEGNEDIRYHMLENESKIFCHLNKRQKSFGDGQPTPLLQIELMSSIQKQNIPFTRDSWRALAWLKTESTNYFYRTVKYNGSECKIIGSKGNHQTKSICFDSKPMKTVQNIDSSYCNCTEFPQNLKINTNTEAANASQVPSTSASIDVVSKPKEKLRLGKNINDYLSKIKPGPLSSKIVQYNKMAMDDEDCFVSTTHAYDMPQVKLKVCPKLNRPLNDGVKPFLKMILPHENITEEWAKFTVSTVMTKSKDRKDENTSNSNEFSFTIPYKNNQEKILVRERKTHKSIMPKDTTDNFNDRLTFANDVAEDDILGNEVAQILTEMTDSVAITLSENNFVQDDPDIDYNQKDDDLQKAEVKKTKDSESKINQKVLKELKKLNAKIISANDNPKKRLTTRCSEKFCENGCVCESLDSEVSRLHCGEVDCAFGCQCKKKNDYAADQASAELERTSLSTDDLNRLCAKATASLAREERDFAPTVILTNNNTMLIHNRNSSQRRITKVPKKFSDYESEDIIQTPTVSSIPPIDTPKILETEKVKVKEILPRPNAEFDHLRHVKVNLKRLTDVSHIEPLCMVHCLYKCYCKNQSRSGKAFRFDEENDFKNLVKDDIADSNELLLQQLPTSYRKRRYSFDRTNAEDSKSKKYRQIGDSRQIQKPPENNFTIEHESIDKNRIEMRNDKEIIQPSPIPSSCVSRRVCPVNRNFYRARNLHSRDRYITESKILIGPNEVKRKLLLEKRIQQCGEFYRSQSVKHRVNYPKLLIKNADKIPIYINVCDTDEKIQSNPILRPLVDGDKVLFCINRNRYILNMEENFDSFIREIVEIISKISKPIPVCVIRRSQDTNDIKSTRDDRNKIGNNFNTIQVLHLLENLAIQPNRNDVKNEDPNDSIVTSIESLLRSLKERNRRGSDLSNPNIFNELVYISNKDLSKIQLMNGRISSTMHKIHQMIIKNSESVLVPSKGLLFLIKWKYLLVAFEDHLINIYEYQTGDKSTRKLIITQKECSAEQLNFLRDCTNIRDLRNILISKIPYEGFMVSKMITGRIEGVSTSNLTILLQGHLHYWIIDGFLNTEKSFVPKSQISKPTPISHPRLSEKIALYYKLMVKNDEILESLEKPRAGNSSAQLPENDCAMNTKEKKVTASHSKKNKSNVEITPHTFTDMNEIRLPAPEIGCASYFALIIVNDFSDLYIASWDTYVSYDKIIDAISLAQTENRSIEVRSENIPPYTPESNVIRMFTLAGIRDKIFIGPYKSRNKLDLMLYQNIDGQMFLREDYLQRNNVKRTSSTVGTWIYVGTPPVENRELWAKRTAELRNNKIPPGTECIIIDSDEEDNLAAVVPSGNPHSKKCGANTDLSVLKSKQRNIKRQRVKKPNEKTGFGKIASTSSEKVNASHEKNSRGKSILITNYDGGVLNVADDESTKQRNQSSLSMIDGIKVGIPLQQNSFKMMQNRKPMKRARTSTITSADEIMKTDTADNITSQVLKCVPNLQFSTITSADEIMKTETADNITAQVLKCVPNLKLLHPVETKTALLQNQMQMPPLVSLSPLTDGFIFNNTTDSKLEYPKAVVGISSSATLESARNKIPSLLQRRISSQMGKRRLRAIAPKKPIVTSSSSVPIQFEKTNTIEESYRPLNTQKSPTARKIIMPMDKCLGHSSVGDNSSETSTEHPAKFQNMTRNNLTSSITPLLSSQGRPTSEKLVNSSVRSDIQDLKINSPKAKSALRHSSATKNITSEAFTEYASVERKYEESDSWELERRSLSLSEVSRLEAEFISDNSPRRIDSQNSMQKPPTAMSFYGYNSSTQNGIATEKFPEELNETPYFERIHGVPDLLQSEKNSLSCSEIGQLEVEPSSLNDNSNGKSPIAISIYGHSSNTGNIDNSEKISDGDLVNFCENSPLKNVIIIDDDDDDDEDTNDQVSFSTINHIDAPDGKYEKGFIISDIVVFGRIRAVKKDNKIYIKTKLSPKFEIADLDKTFSKYVRSMILGTIPVDLNFNWRFEDNPVVYNVYPIHKRGICTKKMVIGKNVFCDITKMNDIHMYLQYYRELLAYRLLATVSSSYQVQSCLYTETIDSTIALIKKLKSQEENLINMKQNEISKKDALEESVKTLKMQANNTNNSKERVRKRAKTNQEAVVTKPDFPDITEILDSDDDS